jgi:hypothetical protein
MPSRTYRLAAQRSALTTLWSFVVSSIDGGDLLTRVRKCNDNIAAYGRRNLPHGSGSHINQRRHNCYIVAILLPISKQTLVTIILDMRMHEA